MTDHNEATVEAVAKAYHEGLPETGPGAWERATERVRKRGRARARAALAAIPEPATGPVQLDMDAFRKYRGAWDATAPTVGGVTREQMIDALLETNLIGGYDWLGTGSSYPTDEEIRSEVGEVADAIFALLGTPQTDFAGIIETVKATGGAVEIAGVRIEPCDEYGRTASTPTPQTVASVEGES